VAGLDSPTRGAIFLNGKNATATPPHQRDVAMVFQNYALYPNRTVRGNLEFPLRLQRLARAEIRQRVDQAARLLGLAHLLDRPPDQLSGGEQQRVALGRAVVRRPRALLLDEPLSNLDAQMRVQMRTELSRWHRQLDTTMLYVTHDQEEAMTLGQRIAVLRDGVLQQLAPPLELFRRPANTFVAGFIGAPAMNLLPCDGTVGETGLLVHSPFFEMRLPECRLSASSPIKLLLGIRPQDVHVSSERSADVYGQVDLVQVLGGTQTLHVNLSAGTQTCTLAAVVAGEDRIQRQERVGLKFRRKRLHFFEAATGQRLALAGEGREST
jgi:ABC-type sugar transport system ATPase subunit